MQYQTFEELGLNEFGEDVGVKSPARSRQEYGRVDWSRDADSQRILRELYESEELLNEGILSFEFPLLMAEDEELDLFLGSLIRKASRAVGNVAKTVGRGVGDAAKAVGKGVSAIDKVIPVSTLINASPLGMAVRAGLGAVQAVAEGRNVFQAAMRGLAADPVSRFLVDTGAAAARGENIIKAAQKAAQAGIGDVRKSLQFAAMVAPFVPGIGTGVGAALGAANALASGQPITEALISAARSAVPGGAVAQVAFDTAMNLAKGKKIGEALLNSARSQLPGGPAAQAAFDAALTLAKGKSIQDAAFAATGRLLPKSPYSADVLSFVQKVASGQNIQRAALSGIGNFVLNKIQQQAGTSFPKVALPGGVARGLSIAQAARAGAARLRQLPHELEDFEEGDVFGETEEMELAAEMLEVSDEAELDNFLGRLIVRAMRGGGSSCSAVPALRQMLRQVAKRTLPVIGGGWLNSGRDTGRRLALAASDLFGLELEGLSPEDQEYETARRFVRFAGASARQARRTSKSAAPRAAAQRAMGAAARRHAPGLLRRRRPAPDDLPPPPTGWSGVSYRNWRPIPISVTCHCGTGVATPADPSPGDTAPPSADPAPADASGDSSSNPVPDKEPANTSNQEPQTTKENDMHDLDRTTLEMEDEAGEFEYSESDNEYGEMETESAFSEEEEAELAAELLEINDEQELDQFIGDLLKKAKKLVGGALKSPILQPLGGFIKGAIKQALPVVGGALGNLVVPGLGGSIGSQLATGAGGLLGLEMENASPEDQEFDAAKRLVRLAGAAVQSAAQNPAAADPQAAAKAAIVAAAQAHAPGLLQSPNGAHQGHRPKSGHWHRHGNKIILVGI